MVPHSRHYCGHELTIEPESEVKVLAGCGLWFWLSVRALALAAIIPLLPAPGIVAPVPAVVPATLAAPARLFWLWHRHDVEQRRNSEKGAVHCATVPSNLVCAVCVCVSVAVPAQGPGPSGTA